MTMTWDIYLILKVGGIAVFVFAGGIAASRGLGITREKAYLINAVSVVCGYFVNRLWYIIQHVYGSEPYEYRSLANAWDAWNDAGSVLYGWVLGGTLATVLLTRFFKLKPVRYLDLVLPWLLVAQCLNRLGCFDAGCCYGSFTNLPIGVQNVTADGMVHPIQLYEAAFDLVLFWFIRTRPPRLGMPTFLYFTAYPTARFVFEFMRGDNLPALWFMTIPQVTSLVILITVFSLRKKVFTQT